MNPNHRSCGTSVSQFIYLFAEGVGGVVQGHSLNAVLFLSLWKIISVYCSQEDYVLSLEIYLHKIWQIFEFEGILIIFLSEETGFPMCADAV